MPSDPRLLVRLCVNTERFSNRLQAVASAFGEFKAALAFTSLPTAETFVAGLQRIHYADHLTGWEPDDGD